VSTCRATGCGKAIPAGQVFCGRCLNVMSADMRHRLLSDKSPAAIGAARVELDRLRGHVTPRRSTSSMPAASSPARDRFKEARARTAEAFAILERNKK